MIYPTLIVEAGWSETRPQLYHDRDVWLKGANGTTEAVLVVKWSRISANRVKGDIELWELNSVNNPALLQHEVGTLRRVIPDIVWLMFSYRIFSLLHQQELHPPRRST